MNNKSLYRATFDKGIFSAFFAVRNASNNVKKAVVKVCDFGNESNAPVIRLKNSNLLTVHELLLASMGDCDKSTARVLKGTGNYSRACFIARLVARASNGGIYCPACIVETGKEYAKLMQKQNRDNRAHNARIESEPDYRAECVHAELMKRGIAMRKSIERYEDCEKFSVVCDESAEICNVDNFGDDSFMD